MFPDTSYSMIWHKGFQASRKQASCYIPSQQQASIMLHSKPAASKHHVTFQASSTIPSKHHVTQAMEDHSKPAASKHHATQAMEDYSKSAASKHHVTQPFQASSEQAPRYTGNGGLFQASRIYYNCELVVTLLLCTHKYLNVLSYLRRRLQISEAGIPGAP